LWGMPPLLAVLASVLIGFTAGMASGLVIAHTGVSAFIVTLAGLQIFKGINLGITEAQPFYGVPQSIKDFGNSSVYGLIPWLILPTILITFAIWYLLNRVRIGRHMLAIGDNRNAAELSGIDIASTVMWAHAISGLLAATAGILLVARLQLGHPTIGDDWLISSFAAPVIGGAILSGGHVSVAGTFFGVVIIAVIAQALVIFAIDPFAVQIVLGALILWAVGINRLRATRIAELLSRKQ
jgi:ribose transport system permease protein